MLNHKFLLPLLVAIVSIIAAPQAQAINSKIAPTQAPCFKVKNNVIIVNRNINPEQLETLKVIKVTQLAYENIILNYSLENNIKQCLQNGQPINGFTIPQLVNKPGMVSIDSQTRYKTKNTFKVIDGKSSFTIRAKGPVDVIFSPSTGYKVTSKLIRY